MTRILIETKTVKGVPYYSFRPLEFIEGFYQRCKQITGCRYRHVDPKARIIPKTEASLSALRKTFGQDCLTWGPEEARGQVPGKDRGRGRAKVSSFNSGQTPESQRKGKQANDSDNRQLASHWQLALHRTEEQLQSKRYSWRTIKGYLSHLKYFFLDHPDLHLKDIDNETIRSYIVRRVAAGNYSESTQGQMLNTIKFWLEQVEGRERAFIDLRPRKPKKLPRVLSVEEVTRLFRAVKNIKHRCILKAIYSGGLRLSEVCNLRIMDIHSDRMQLFVHGGKGKKDRYTTLSQAFLKELREYFKLYRPTYWLFEGQTGGQYSVRSVQAILRKGVDKSGINPHATVHTLRHSYATHLLEQGTSLRHIQELLGHQNSQTTEIYTHVSNKEKQRIISPLDRIEELD